MVSLKAEVLKEPSKVKNEHMEGLQIWVVFGNQYKDIRTKE